MLILINRPENDFMVRINRLNKLISTSDMTKPTTFEEYLVAFPAETQKMLVQLRETIKKSAPEAEEVISYGMPSFRQNGQLLYFAGFKNHIGFYPLMTGVEAFKTELSSYKWGKGSIQFPLQKPLPLGLITRIVKFRVKENTDKSKTTRKR
jgi:uncharacterized protein YdhG (YjbR/CyaY superfamily)